MYHSAFTALTYIQLNPYPRVSSGQEGTHFFKSYFSPTPLFTAGLLSDNSPSSSRSTSPKRRVRRSKKTTHDSLPLTVNSATFSVYAPHADHESAASALYLTLKPSRRQRQEGHSFLSLDLADTLSLRRKDTVTSRATTVFSGREPLSPASPVP